MEISRKQADKMKGDGVAYEFSDIKGQDFLLVDGFLLTIKEEMDADEKEEEKRLQAEYEASLNPVI